MFQTVSMVKWLASLNSWICDWSNMEKTFEVARCARCFPPDFFFAFRLAYNKMTTNYCLDWDIPNRNKFAIVWSKRKSPINSWKVRKSGSILRFLRLLKTCINYEERKWRNLYAFTTVTHAEGFLHRTPDRVWLLKKHWHGLSCHSTLAERGSLCWSCSQTTH